MVGEMSAPGSTLKHCNSSIFFFIFTPNFHDFWANCSNLSTHLCLPVHKRWDDKLPRSCLWYLHSQDAVFNPWNQTSQYFCRSVLLISFSFHRILLKACAHACQRASLPFPPRPKETLQGPARPECRHPVLTSLYLWSSEDPTPSPCCQGTVLQKRPCQCWVIAQLRPITANILRPHLLLTHLRPRLPFPRAQFCLFPFSLPVAPDRVLLFHQSFPSCVSARAFYLQCSVLLPFTLWFVPHKCIRVIALPAP